MVIAASDALSLSNNTVVQTTASDIQIEVSLAENRIRGAAGLGLYSTSYNATIIGNPSVDPRTHTDLPPNQITFFNLFVDAGFTVSVDTATGYWFFAWSAESTERLVQIYTLRTIFDPTGIVGPIITAIEAYFTSLRPIVHSTVSYNGFIDEAGFGGTTSQFFEFTIVVDQQDTIDNSFGLKTAVTGQGLGLTSGNCNVYRLVL